MNANRMATVCAALRAVLPTFIEADPEGALKLFLELAAAAGEEIEERAQHGY